MKLDFRLNEEDFLTFQLYTASKSKRISEKLKRDLIILIVGFFLFGLYFLWEGNMVMTSCFGIFILVTALFYPRYFKKKYRDHYQLFIKENYSNRIGVDEHLEFSSRHIFSNNHIGEGKLNMNEVEQVNEIDTHFFIQISTGESLIIPKSQVENVSAFKLRLRALDLKLNQELSWSW